MSADIEALWNEYRQRILNYIQFKIGPDDSEDMTQIVFLRALQAIRGDKGPTEHESGWLWRIVNNVVVDYYRFRGRLPDFVELDEIFETDTDVTGGLLQGELLTSPDAGPDELVLQNIESERVRAAIKRLPSEKQINTINMRLEGYTSSQIAELLGANENTIKQQATRAYTNLREWLREAA